MFLQHHGQEAAKRKKQKQNDRLRSSSSPQKALSVVGNQGQRDNYGRAHHQHRSPGESSHGEGPDQVELFLCGHSPKRINGRPDEPVKHQVPVACEKKKTENRGLRQAKLRAQGLNQQANQHHKVIQRPYPENSPNIKHLQVDITRLSFFPRQQFGNQVSAQQKEELYAIFP